MNLYLAEIVASTVFLWLGMEALREWRWSRRQASLPCRSLHRNIGNTQRVRVEYRRSVEAERKAA